MLLNYLQSKPKNFVVLLFSVVSLAILVLSTQIAELVCTKGAGIVVAFMLVILVALPLHLFAKKHPILYVCSYATNIIGCGFSVSSYYLTKSIGANILDFLISALPSAALLTAAYLLFKHLKSKKLAVGIAAAINILMLAASVNFWIETAQTFFSFGFFCLVVSLFFVFVYGITIDNRRSVLRDISLGSFGVFIIITMIVLIIISEGEIADFGDLDPGSSGSSKKKAKKL